MFSLLQQTAPVVVEETETVVVTESAEAAAHGADAAGAAAGHAVAGAADAAHAAAGHAASAPGMPQLDVSTFGNQIFWLIVVLAVIYWVLSRVALPRIGGVISDRQGAITGDLMAAEEFKQKAKEAEAAYDKALADARAEANKIVAANKAEIQKELDAAIAHADAEIAARAAESEKRIGEIRASAVEDARLVARDVTAALIENFGGSADAAAINAAVDQRLKGALQ
ncbi:MULTISPECIES: F0F1 ATP synthase subunit B' [unclassified Paracoccus (in: a-proteobacteria)]|uniref:F0F1 ATP synthase subunit B' n=1 Tax=unclassified Paracoccus (in: a-proteobacteria) TaxID=2688777 RepID=UPI0012B2189D|nr:MULTISPECIES: F0F1 ATP synthase subunit B' [unclassified Paracoccus (in: a-proteobacteria)]UXU74958.1 F0F1 ATP synthase subunit B' [Paracoccus sp. SMMA_5]UXU80861.1 F0F1 ATP synthase subunit B' [Paracoccus sp. SMMA_5_TC]